MLSKKLQDVYLYEYPNLINDLHTLFTTTFPDMSIDDLIIEDVPVLDINGEVISHNQQYNRIYND